MRKSLFYLLLFVFPFGEATAQLGTWNIVNVKTNLSSRWSLFGEAQIRSLRFYNHFHYYEYKAGASYNIGKNFSVLGGFGGMIPILKEGHLNSPW